VAGAGAIRTEPPAADRRARVALVGDVREFELAVEAAWLRAESEPALLDLCAVPLAAGGPHAALVRGPQDPSTDRFTVITIGQGSSRWCRVRASRGGGCLMAVSSSLVSDPTSVGAPARGMSQGCPVLAHPHLRSALAAGHLAAAILREDEAVHLVAEGLARDIEWLAEPAGGPPRLALDSGWSDRHPEAAKRLVAQAQTAARSLP